MLVIRVYSNYMYDKRTKAKPKTDNKKGGMKNPEKIALLFFHEKILPFSMLEQARTKTFVQHQSFSLEINDFLGVSFAK